MSQTMLATPLRTCIHCGVEANTEAELALFTKCETSLHGHMNVCKKCTNERESARIKGNDRAYLLRTFTGMRHRCYNSKRENYYKYGGRGITICQEWLDNPDSFIEWALSNGFKRELSIDRIDNREGYSPDNCQWSTSKEQARNTRRDTTDLNKGTRICSKCRTEKKLIDFYRNRSRLAGRDYLCIPCEKARKGTGGDRH